MTIPYLCILFVLQFLSSVLARSIDDTGVQYKVFDNNYNLVDIMDIQLPKNKSLIVIVHGFRSSSTTTVNYGKSVVKLTDSNVVLVDWSKWTLKLDYVDILPQLPTVALYLVDWLNSLRDNGIINSFDNVTLIGHSLGAHLIGYTGTRLNGTVRRIIALDPAQPYFKRSQKIERVNVNSGQFVMVLHTSTIFFGLRDPVGHVDFYFNGGQSQPSCYTDGGCAHLIVLNYLVDSLKNSSTYLASRCCTLEDCENKIVDNKEPTIYMNIDLPISTRGLYLVVPEKKKLRFSQQFDVQEVNKKI